MKATLSRHVIATRAEDVSVAIGAGMLSVSAGLNRMYCRTIESDDAKQVASLGFYPIAAHMQHGCEPNAHLLIRDGKLRVLALRPLEKGEEVTMSYLPFESCEGPERQLHLARIFQMTCHCSKCTQDQ